MGFPTREPTLGTSSAGAPPESCPGSDFETGETFSMKILGGLIFLVGVFLFLGNVVGFFPSFPGAGYLTLALGGWLYKRA